MGFLIFFEWIIAESLVEEVGCGRFLAKGANQFPILGDLTKLRKGFFRLVNYSTNKCSFISHKLESPEKNRWFYQESHLTSTSCHGNLTLHPNHAKTSAERQRTPCQSCKHRKIKGSLEVPQLSPTRIILQPLSAIFSLQAQVMIAKAIVPWLHSRV